MTRLTAAWAERPETRAVTDTLEAAGHQALFVGGCVRNALIGAPVADIDIATDATPQSVLTMFETSGFTVVPTGIDHGTVTVVSGHTPYEITTFRRDIETDGRRAVVAYSTDIADDARRRDFTMNALYAAPDGLVRDPLGTGLADLRERRVRFIEDPIARIREDYLRILRFFRFYAWYGDAAEGPDPDALAAIAGSLDGLDRLSAERVGAEMHKLAGAADPAPSIATMAQVGVLTRILPGSDAKALPILIDIETRLGIAPDPVRRLAALGGEDPSGRLRLSKKDARRLQSIRTSAFSDTNPAELGYRLGAEVACDAVAVRAALSESGVSDNALMDIGRGATAQFPLRASDLADRFEGPALGAALRAAEDRWIASGFSLDRTALLSDSD